MTRYEWRCECGTRGAVKLLEPAKESAELIGPIRDLHRTCSQPLQIAHCAPEARRDRYLERKRPVTVMEVRRNQL
jgi:hypothetical protein